MFRRILIKDSNWDLDLRAGEAGESYVADLLHADTIEVKTDRRWKDTGNLYVETYCFQQSSQTWEKSGVLVSKATHWAFVIDDAILIVPTRKLKQAVLDIGWHTETKMPPNPTKGYLISPSNLIAYIKSLNDDFDNAGEHYKNLVESGDITG